MPNRVIRQMFVGLLPWSAAACSDGTDITSTEGQTTATFDESQQVAPTQSWQEAFAEYQRLLSTPLSSDEQIEVERFLENQGLDMTRVSVQGRILIVDDILVYADSVLGNSTTGDKGRTWTAPFTATVFTGSFPSSTYSRDTDGAANPAPYEFWRAHVNTTHFYIVPDSPSFLLPLFESAIASILGAADDCLGDLPLVGLDVMNETAWRAIGQGQASITNTFVWWSGPVFNPDGTRNGRQNACGDTTGGTAGCASFPRFNTAYTIPPGVSPMNFGGAMGLVSGSGLADGSTYVDGNNAKSKAIVMHEILHTLGVTHPYDEVTPKTIVPGTSSSGDVHSIMQRPSCTPGTPQGGQTCSTSSQCGAGRSCSNGVCSCNNDNQCNGSAACVTGTCMCNWSHSLTSDDVATLDTLYSPVPGGNCGYQHNFQTACWDGCTRVSSTSLAGHCCYCNGVRKTFKTSAFSTTLFICDQ